MRQWRTHCFPLLELQTPNNTHTQLVALSSTLPARRPLGVCVWMACSCLDRSVERGGSWKGPPPPPPQHRAAPATWAGRCTWHPYDSLHLFSQCRKAIPVTLTCYGSPLLEGGGKKKKITPRHTPNSKSSAHTDQLCTGSRYQEDKRGGEFVLYIGPLVCSANIPFKQL